MMKKEKITAARLKKYVSLFEGAGIYWICLLMIPVTDVFVSAMNALFYQKIINAVSASDTVLFQKALWIAALVLAVSMARCLLIYSYMYQIRQIMARLRMRVMKHLFCLPMSYFESHHTADSIQKLCFNVEDIKNSLANGHQKVISPVIIGGSAIVLILLLDPWIGLMVLVLSLISVRINMILSRPLRSMAVGIQRLLAQGTESLTDILAGIDVIKMFPGALRIVKRYNDINEETAASTMKRFRRMSDVQAVEWIFGFLCNIVILIIGVFMSFAGLVDFGTVVAVLSLQGMVSYFLSNIGSAWGSLIDAFVLADRVFEILDQPVQADFIPAGKENEVFIPCMTDFGILIREAEFSYDGSEKVLRGVNIMAKRGEMAALVGGSGSGKSTVIKLLLGFYQPDRGIIGVNGKPLYCYAPEELRRMLAYVPQDARLFATTIKENIRYGRPDADDGEIIEAAKRAYAHDFIMEFPDGYDTMVGERGESLSGGQRQRIAIARAFLRNAPILLLDEATSALDSESEQLVQKGIEALMGGRTTLVVAHRLSTVEKADTIYVMEAGKVCEQGGHRELMEQNGIYRRLVELSGRN